MSTPLELGKKFRKQTEEEERCDKSIYQQATGCLTHVSTTRRPDNAAAVVTLSQFMSDPSKEIWMGVKRILRYIKGTLSYGLKFSVNDDKCDLYGFFDADWAGDADNRRSILPGMFSKSPIPQSVDVARNRLQSLNPLQRQNMLP